MQPAVQTGLHAAAGEPSGAREKLHAEAEAAARVGLPGDTSNSCLTACFLRLAVPAQLLGSPKARARSFTQRRNLLPVWGCQVGLI